MRHASHEPVRPLGRIAAHRYGEAWSELFHRQGEHYHGTHLSNTRFDHVTHAKATLMNNIVYIVGAIVIIVALLSFFGLR